MYYVTRNICWPNYASVRRLLAFSLYMLEAHASHRGLRTVQSATEDTFV